MKITTLLLLLILPAGASLFAQTPEQGRDRIHSDQTTLDMQRMQSQEMEEKRLRLVEAISDGYMESALIMKQEALLVMEREVGEGTKWVEKNGAFPPLERMKQIMDQFSQLGMDPLSAEKAQKAGNMVFEFENLMNRAPF